MNPTGREKIKQIKDYLSKPNQPVEKLIKTLDYVRQHGKRHPGDLQLFVASGAVPITISLLDHPAAKQPSNRGETLAEHVVFLLSHLVSEQAARAQLGTEFAVSHLVAFMWSTSNESARSRACSTLAALFTPPTGSSSSSSEAAASSSSPVKNYGMPQRQLYDILATVIMNQFDAVANNAGYAEGFLKTLCSLHSAHYLPKIPLLKKTLIKMGIVKRVAGLLNKLDNDSVEQWILMTLMSLMKDPGSDDMATDISKQIKDSITGLVQLASHETPGVQQAALDLLTLICQIYAWKSDIGSRGVIAAFLTHLAFDEQQTTVSNMQKKLVLALAACCRDGFNRAKLKDLDGLPVFIGILKSPLYEPVQLAVLSCLPEFRHDKSTVTQLIELGAVSVVVSFLGTAVDVLKERKAHRSHVHETAAKSADNITGRESSSTALASGEAATKRFSLNSPSYRIVVEGSQRVLHSPSFSPPQMAEELNSYSPLRSVSPAGSPVYVTTNSPEWSNKRKNREFEKGRYSPVIETEFASSSSLAFCQEGSKKSKASDEPVSDERMAKRARLSEIGPENAKKCLKYCLAFLESISVHADLAKYLASKSTLDVLLECIRFERARPVVDQILLRIVRDPLCFEQTVKGGFVLCLKEGRSEDSSDVKASRSEMLQELRIIAQGEFGFGELLHLCLRTTRPGRLACIATAAILLQNRSERFRLFEKHGVLEMVMAALSTPNSDPDAPTSEEWKMLAQTGHAFFASEVEGRSSHNQVIEEPADDSCHYQSSLEGLSDEEQVVCSFESDEEDDDVDTASGELVINKSVISGASQVFSAMLGANFREGRQSRILIGEAAHRPFEAVTHYICGCRLDNCRFLYRCSLDHAVLLDVYQLADRFLEFDLKETAKKNLIYRCLSPACIAEVFDEAVKRSLEEISDAVVEWIMKDAGMTDGCRAENLSALLYSEHRELALSHVRALMESCL